MRITHTLFAVSLLGVGFLFAGPTPAAAQDDAAQGYEEEGGDEGFDMGLLGLLGLAGLAGLRRRPDHVHTHTTGTGTTGTTGMGGTGMGGTGGTSGRI